MRFLVDRLPLGEVFFRVQRLCSVKAILPMHHTRLDHNIPLSEGQESQAKELANMEVFFLCNKTN
jgi:hypothetical protein